MKTSNLWNFDIYNELNQHNEPAKWTSVRRIAPNTNFLNPQQTTWAIASEKWLRIIPTCEMQRPHDSAGKKYQARCIFCIYIIKLHQPVPQYSHKANTLNLVLFLHLQPDGHEFSQLIYKRPGLRTDA